MSSGKKKNQIEPDYIYSSVTVAKLINYIMREGKKNAAQKIVYGAFEILKDKTKKDPLLILEQAIKNAAPILEVRPKRIGGATYQVPVEVSPKRRMILSMRWIIEAAKARKGSMKNNLAEEILEAANNAGSAVRKKENTHKMAEANRAFAHFA